MKKALLAAILLVGCTPPPEKVAEVSFPSYIEERSAGCSHAGYCFTCMPGFDLKMTCGPKFSSFCPGTRTFKAKVTPLEVYYSNGKIRKEERVEELEQIRGCH